jgi:prepilin-type N-terminal cleavage/methylation domain-containing protein
MKKPLPKSAFTLIELLVVIFVVAICAALLFTARGRPRPAFVARCLVNQKQITLGFNIWVGDNGKFPWQVSVTNAGTMEYAERGYAAPNFRILSNILRNPEIFTCPTDKGKTAATNLAQFNNQNVSYFIGFDPGTNQPTSILTGDRHLENNGKPIKPGLFVYSNGSVMSWTHELHGNVKRPIGCLGFVDSHAEVVRGETLASIFQRQGSATNRIAVP